MTPPRRLTGVMIRFVRTRGFAFASDGQGHEYFVHRTSCEPPALFDSLQDGDAVTFQTRTTAKGPRAFDLQLATPREAVALSRDEQEARGNR